MRTIAIIYFIGISFLLSFINTIGQDVIERIEPPFWWVDMNNQELQLMVYGENISSYNPSLNHEGVSIERIHKLKSPNYLFVDLIVSENTKAGSFNLVFQNEANQKLIYKYTLFSRDKNSAGRKGFDASDVIYLITPDRYVNGDPGNDSNENLIENPNRSDPNGRHGGDLQGVTNSLDYIQDMGFTAIWLNPVLENNQHKFSYHGYSITDFYCIDKRFGSNEDFKEMVAIARDKDIKVIMDMIVNHCGSNHWWMKDLPTDNWLNFQDDFEYTTHLRETIQDPYASEWDKRLHADGWFTTTMPDMNQRNELLARYLIQNTIWWIEYSGLSGIRMDTYPYSDKNFMAEWTRTVMEEYPDFNIVGEEWSLNPSIIAFWQKGKVNPNGYTSELPALMDFPMQNAVVEAMNEDDKDWGNGVIKLYTILANDFVYANPGNLVVFPDNHDMSRIFTQLNEDYDLFKMTMMYFAVTRGIPQIYYGTEILMKNPGTTDHGIIRSDFPGGWEGDKKDAFSQKGLSRQEKEAQDFMKKLLNWRKDQNVIHNGELLHFAPTFGYPVYTLFRYNDEKIIMLAINKSEHDIELDLEKYREEMIGDVKSAKDVITEKIIIFADDKLPVKGRSAVLLEIEK